MAAPQPSSSCLAVGLGQSRELRGAQGSAVAPPPRHATPRPPRRAAPPPRRHGRELLPPGLEMAVAGDPLVPGLCLAMGAPPRCTFTSPPASTPSQPAPPRRAGPPRAKQPCRRGQG